MRSIKFILILLLICAPSLAFAQTATVYFDNFLPADALTKTLMPQETFTAEVRINSTVNLRGVHLAFRVEPIGAVSVKSVEMPDSPPASDIYEINESTNRLLFMRDSGIASGITQFAKVTFEVPQRTISANAKLIINVLQLIRAGVALDSSVINNYEVTYPSVDIDYTPTDPDPDPDPDTPTPTPADGPYSSTSSQSLYSVFGGCNISVGSRNTKSILPVLLVMLVIIIVVNSKKRAKIMSVFFFTLFIAALSFGKAGAEIYYVDNDGSGCSGATCPGSYSQPFSTIAQAMSKKLIPGDIIEVRGGGGAYQEETLLIDYPVNGNGILGVPIILRGSGNPTIDGQNHAAIGIQRNSSYWVIENITFTNGGAWGNFLVSNSTPAIIGGEQAGVGFIIRDNTFTGTISDYASSKNAIRLVSQGFDFYNFFEGHLIENNTFQNITSQYGYAFISLVLSSYSIIRGNTIIHNPGSNPADNAPLRHISVQDSHHNIIERNFSAGYFRGFRGSANIVLANLSTPAIVRNNILYMQAAPLEGSETDDQPIAAIRMLEGSSSVRNRIHNNSIKIDKDAGADARVVAPFYSGDGYIGSDIINNIAIGGDYVAGGSYYNDYSNGGTSDPHFRMDYNVVYDQLIDLVMPRFDDPKHRCYIGWWHTYVLADQTNCEAAPPAYPTDTNNVVDAAETYTAGGSVWTDSYYLSINATGSTSGGTGLSRCTDIDNDLVACGAVTGATGQGASGAPIYSAANKTVGFTFCGDTYPAARPDRVLDLRDVIQTWQTDTTLAAQVADYLLTLSDLSLPADCFDEDR